MEASPALAPRATVSSFCFCRRLRRRRFLRGRGHSTRIAAPPEAVTLLTYFEAREQQTSIRVSATKEQVPFAPGGRALMTLPQPVTLLATAFRADRLMYRHCTDRLARFTGTVLRR